jgi:hypothetical protein
VFPPEQRARQRHAPRLMGAVRRRLCGDGNQDRLVSATLNPLGQRWAVTDDDAYLVSPSHGDPVGIVAALDAIGADSHLGRVLADA